MKVLNIFLRLLFVFIPPFIAVFFLYHAFSLSITFDIGSGRVDPNTLKQFIIETLGKQEQRFELFTPMINPKWFLYQVNLKNNMKIAVEATEPKYSEHETILIIEADRNIPIHYGMSEGIASDLKREDILKEFKGYGFAIQPKQQISVGPGQEVKFEHSPLLGNARMMVSPTYLSAVFIYIFAFVFWGGLIILTKPIFQFIYLGKHWWLKT